MSDEVNAQTKQAQAATAIQEYWRKVSYEAPIKSIERIEEAAKLGPSHHKSPSNAVI